MAEEERTQWTRRSEYRRIRGSVGVSRGGVTRGGVNRIFLITGSSYMSVWESCSHL